MSKPPDRSEGSGSEVTAMDTVELGMGMMQLTAGANDAETCGLVGMLVLPVQDAAIVETTVDGTPPDDIPAKVPAPQDQTDAISRDTSMPYGYLK